MSNPSGISPKTTVVIPLYRSAQFADNIKANIAAIESSDVEILISDRHCHDNTIDRLADYYGNDHRVRCIKQRDERDWVGHLNFLLEEARGNFWRFLPHDDISPPGSLEALVAALEANGDAILAYGPTKAIDARGMHLPQLDRPAPHPAEAEQGWTLGLALQMFWRGYFDGAFKGLIRRNTVIENNLLIRSTRDQIFPERCWLFALCLLGRFHFVPEATYIKRFHAGSVHSGWNIRGSNVFSAADVMSGYLNTLVDSEPARLHGTQDLWLNARRMAKLHDSLAWKLLRKLPWLNTGRTARWRNGRLWKFMRKILRHKAATNAEIELIRKMQLPCNGKARGIAG